MFFEELIRHLDYLVSLSACISSGYILQSGRGVIGWYGLIDYFTDWLASWLVDYGVVD